MNGLSLPWPLLPAADCPKTWVVLLEFTAAELAVELLDWLTGPLFEPSESTETGALALMGTIWVEVALELADAIAVNGPLALRATKRILTESVDWSESEFWHRQGEITGPVMGSEDAREGAIAFAEKRAPVWKGR